ncbi:MAG: RNA polymerase sigma factor [Tannerella sp.]|jgi:RNA polymerase sigma factor (sigma-70 family)|nr:RNA polymerase sigma factor [Tannerella sp.]
MKNDDSLYCKYVDDLFKYGISLGFGRESCEDAIHDVYLHLYSERIADTLRDVRDVKAYLFRSVKNRLIDLQKRENIVIYTDGIEELPFKIDFTVLDSIIAKEKAAILKAKIDRLLSMLTPRQREAVYLRYIQELEYEQIAQVLDMEVESVRKLVHRGLEKLRKEADPELFMVLIGALFAFRV